MELPQPWLWWCDPLSLDLPNARRHWLLVMAFLFFVFAATGDHVPFFADNLWRASYLFTSLNFIVLFFSDRRKQRKQVVRIAALVIALFSIRSISFLIAADPTPMLMSSILVVLTWASHRLHGADHEEEN